VTERKNVLALFFFLLALPGWIKFTDERRVHPWRWYGLALVFYVRALLSKTTACTLPAALVLEQQGKPAEAREEFSEVLRLKPGDAEAQRELKKPGGVQILRQ
jgi:hypothetical protein